MWEHNVACSGIFALTLECISQRQHGSPERGLWRSAEWKPPVSFRLQGFTALWPYAAIKTAQDTYKKSFRPFLPYSSLWTGLVCQHFGIWMRSVKGWKYRRIALHNKSCAFMSEPCKTWGAYGLCFTWDTVNHSSSAKLNSHHQEDQNTPVCFRCVLFEHPRSTMIRLETIWTTNALQI